MAMPNNKKRKTTPPPARKRMKMGTEELGEMVKAAVKVAEPRN